MGGSFLNMGGSFLHLACARAATGPDPASPCILPSGAGPSRALACGLRRALPPRGLKLAAPRPT
eukprot:10681527-Heterocapsa_arctica.AAC.1